MPRGLVPFGQTLERALPQQALRRDVAVLDFDRERRLNPCRLWLSDRFSEFRLWTDDRVELLSNLTWNGARPTCPDLSM
jgi:hypothetical protein